MINRIQLKEDAKHLKAAAVPAAWKVTLVYVLLVAALGIIPGYQSYLTEIGGHIPPSLSLCVMVMNLITGFLAYGYNTSYTLNIARQQPASYTHIFDGFRNLLQVFLLQLLTYVYVFLWSLLFIIPGIIASYRYAMAPYILRDNPGMPVSEAIRQSKEMMMGHKMDLFVLQLSFIGWALLVPLTFGILSLWLVPYMSTTTALFYEEIRGGDPYDDGSYTMASFTEEPSDYKDITYDDDDDDSGL